MTKLYVVILKSGRAGPILGKSRQDIPIDVSDKGEDSYEYARREAPKIWAKKNNLSENRAMVIGVY